MTGSDAEYGVNGGWVGIYSGILLEDLRDGLLCIFLLATHPNTCMASIPPNAFPL